MRPVNLIPPDQRRGDSAVSRTGPVAYMLVGALALVLAGVSMLVLTGNDISERKSEIAELKVEHQDARQRADQLAAYTQFQAVRDQRTATISGLADSRFDWERVVRELSLVLPSDVWLTSMAATVAPGITVEGAGGVPGREAAPGPALELVGCAPGHEGVARFANILRDIDGVTRVGLPSSELPEAGSVGGGGEDCRTRDFIAQFKLVAVFDAAPAPGVTAAAPPVAPPVVEEGN